MAQTEDFLTTTGSTSARTTTDLGAGDGRTSEDIRSDIERTRSEMDQTFAALDAKLTPREMALEAWHLVKGGSTAGAAKLWGIAREHPMPAALIGLGVGWLLVETSRGDGRAEEYRAAYAGDLGSEDYGFEDFEAEESEGRLAAVREKVRGVAGSARERAGRLGHRAADLGHRAKDRASLLGHRAQDRALRARTGFWRTLEEKPLTVGVATFALGLIAGLAIPSTEREDELMGEARDRLLEEAKAAGQQTLEKGRHVADAVAETVQEEARSQNLTPEGAVNRARQAAEHMRESTRTEAHVEEPELAKR